MPYISIDFNLFNQFVDQFVFQFANLTPEQIIWNLLFQYWGWVVFLYIFLRYLAYPEYMFYINNRWYDKNITTILLAIDIPKKNEQSIQAMENFFDHLLGAHGTFTKWAKYIEGEFQLSFSCELVSIEGNVQFLIRTPKHLRNLVEAAIYGQFPDAEITEVEDYTTNVPRYFPNETHDLYGCEFSLSNKSAAKQYAPIKTYLKFQDRFTEVFVDPMAALLETMSQIGKGEQIWIQYLVKPLAVDWGIKKGQAVVSKILGVPPPPVKKSSLENVAGQASSILSEFTQELAGISFTATAEEKKKEGPPSMIQFLSPAQRELIEGVERKIYKLGFDVKIRYLYIAEKGKMNKSVGVNGLIGSFKQWTDMNSNGFKPMLAETGTNSPGYILIEWRRNTRRNYIMGAYRKRDMTMGMVAQPMCSEELASLWHFPSMFIKAPMLKTTDFTKAAAPVGLPFGEAPVPAVETAKPEVIEKGQVTPTFDYDSDDFEMQFAKDKEGFKKDRAQREKRLQEIASKQEQNLKKVSELKPVEKKDANPPGNLPFLD